jgi:catechol-2,3-dioxygenase
MEGESTIEGERGEVVHYLDGEWGSVGLRETAGPADVDRYAIGLHHLAFDAPSRGAVDAVAGWLMEVGAPIEGGPGERGYSPGYYAVFFFDPDGLKLEVVHQPPPSPTPA